MLHINVDALKYHAKTVTVVLLWSALVLHHSKAVKIIKLCSYDIAKPEVNLKACLSQSYTTMPSCETLQLEVFSKQNILIQ
jgi:hypothetical protein